MILGTMGYMSPEQAQGKTKEIDNRSEFSRTAELSGTPPEVVKKMKDVYAKNGWRAYVEMNLEQLESRPAQARLPPFVMATFYAQLDRKDEALAWLEKGYTERDFRMTLLGVAYEFDGLRSDPRFKELVHRMGLPE